MRFSIFFPLILLIFLSTIVSVSAETDAPDPKQDTVRVYHLGSVIDVRTDIEKSSIPSAPVNIDYRTLNATDAVSFNQIANVMPATFFQTNSRGEALLYIRGSGDRRTEIFWDGMLLNLPWDRRYDLQMVPTYLIGNISVSNGSASILYGSNTMGGAVDIASVERHSEGFGGNVRFLAGSGNMYDVSVSQDGRVGNFNYVANIGYYTRDGIVLDGDSKDMAKAGSVDLQNINPGSDLITNSDESRMNMYFRGEYNFTPKLSAGLSFLHTAGEKGVTPETNTDDPRLWRYPDYSRSTVSCNIKSELTEKQNLKLVSWVDFFKQDIDNYSDLNYNGVTDRVSDDIRTLGTRLSYDYEINKKYALTASASTYYTEAAETSTNFLSMAIQNSFTNEYSELLYDLGAEFRYRPVDKLVISAGGLFSGRKNPLTGEYVEQEGTSSNDLGGIFGMKYFATNKLSVFGNISRKASYPSLRQTYANDPKKYKPNPDLSPEHGILSEIGLKFKNDDFSIQSAGFYNYYSDMLSKSKLKNDPEGRKYIRVNLSEGYIAGAEFVGEFSGIKNLDLNATFTYMYGRGKSDAEAEEEYLDYVPEMMANMSASYKLPWNFKITFEADYIGTQYDAGDELDPSLFLNGRLGYTLPVSFSATEIFVRCNNLLDEQRFQKLGLPSPGRTVMAGLKAHM
jgi:iron complex outermembrane recepter protein